MALNLSKSFTFSPSTTIASSQVNTDLDTLYNAFSGLEAGTSSMSKLPLDADPTSALYAATKQYVDAYANYKRPQLTFISVSLVDVSVNTDTANKTKIVFPDGNYRSVTEDTSSSTKYRRFDITATAEFTTGTEDSGLRSGISEAANTWYAIYAVKSTINTANFVLAGDTTLPTITNVATLNSRYGSNGWIYLGLIRNGDGTGAASDIVSFHQAGNRTAFNNNLNPAVQRCHGILMATTAGATTLAYTYAAGTAAAQVPNNVAIVDWIVQSSATAGTSGVRLNIQDGGATWYLGSVSNDNVAVTFCVPGVAPNDGVALVTTGSPSLSYDIVLTSVTDDALGVGSNPFI